MFLFSCFKKGKGVLDSTLFCYPLLIFYTIKSQMQILCYGLALYFFEVSFFRLDVSSKSSTLRRNCLPMFVCFKKKITFSVYWGRRITNNCQSQNLTIFTNIKETFIPILVKTVHFEMI